MRLLHVSCAAMTSISSTPLPPFQCCVVQIAVNTIVDVAHAAAADDCLCDTSVVNIEMGERGAGGHTLAFPDYLSHVWITYV